ncbi:zinc finger protein 148 [Musca vetustissima]|uniref:zinc finger protein 148 n=1 Tax=Musca vetustissima TaxID=27455 RepID=UPI002AB75B91|nr:zinc finger protein 148 [Musca vetustissima]
MKYLRQHYQKVHLAKNFVCDDCGKAFSLDSQLRKHKRDVCGKAFACRECGWPYESLEALLTHGKRKGHNVKEVITITKREGRLPVNPKSGGGGKFRQQSTKATAAADSPMEMMPMVDNKDKMMSKQTEEEINGNYQLPATPSSSTSSTSTVEVNLCPTQMSAGVQTECFPELMHSPNTTTSQDISNALDEIHSLLRDIETQTEPPLLTDNQSNENQNYLDQMLAAAQSAHMYTQTCDDFLSELGLADIQTQTNWPSPQRNVEEKLQYTSTATSTNPCIHDELLVSTETQTSFTQCLLNSCTDTGTSTPPVSFGSLYHTSSQHTQTSDPYLESFDFGGQASDLMDGFQSTYTQT